MGYSVYIDDFLSFLRKAQEDYSIATLQESDTNNETQDILHRIELDDNSYHEYARLSKALRRVRKDRREAKDTVMQLQPVVEWLAENSKTVRDLEKLLGAVRKVEKQTENRFYIPKTAIVDETLGGGTSDSIRRTTRWSQF